jgi:hypothetical protein
MRHETKPPPGGGGNERKAKRNHGLTVVVAEALLFAEFESGVEDRTVAVLVSVLLGGATTLTPMVIVTGGSAGASVPMVTWTVPFVPTAGPVQTPTELTHDWKVVPLGSGSLTSTLVAEIAPRLSTVTV